MNQNIEIIIPGKLAAVKFSYIPFISEIQYTPDEKIPAYSECCRITDGGVMLLNKDVQGYDILKGIFSKVTLLSSKKLLRQINKYKNLPTLKPADELYTLCLEAERERREKQARR